jgi:hypothetical protein
MSNGYILVNHLQHDHLQALTYIFACQGCNEYLIEQIWKNAHTMSVLSMSVGILEDRMPPIVIERSTTQDTIHLFLAVLARFVGNSNPG